MNPRRAEFQALFTSLSPGGSRNETLQMVAAHHRTFWRVVASFESSLFRKTLDMTHRRQSSSQLTLDSLLRLDRTCNYRQQGGCGGFWPLFAQTHWAAI